MDRCELLCLDLEKAEALRARRIDADTAAQRAAGARALGDPTRLMLATVRDARVTTPEVATLPAAVPSPSAKSAEWVAAARRVRILSWISLVWMTAEGAIAVTAGILAGSIALIGFGIDSAIEGLASGIIIWRFTGHRIHSEAAEGRAQKLVAIQFFLLAPYLAVEAILHLAGGERPDSSWLGIALTTSSVIGMPLLGVAKRRLAAELGSAATKGEGNQNLLCAYLAAAVLVGLLANSLLGLWWLDPVAALSIAAVALREGVETWRGEACCAAPELAPQAQRCQDDCCA